MPFLLQAWIFQCNPVLWIFDFGYVYFFLIVIIFGISGIVIINLVLIVIPIFFFVCSSVIFAFIGFYVHLTIFPLFVFGPLLFY